MTEDEIVLKTIKDRLAGACCGNCAYRVWLARTLVCVQLHQGLLLDDTCDPRVQPTDYCKTWKPRR